MYHYKHNKLCSDKAEMSRVLFRDAWTFRADSPNRFRDPHKKSESPENNSEKLGNLIPIFSRGHEIFRTWNIFTVFRILIFFVPWVILEILSSNLKIIYSHYELGSPTVLQDNAASLPKYHATWNTKTTIFSQGNWWAQILTIFFSLGKKEKKIKDRKAWELNEGPVLREYRTVTSSLDVWRQRPLPVGHEGTPFTVVHTPGREISF